MHILYFAVRRHHWDYFSKLAAQPCPDSQTVVRHKSSVIPDTPSFSAVEKQGIHSAVRLKLKEVRQHQTHYWLPLPAYLIKKLFYTLLGAWLLLCYRRTLKQKKVDAVVMWSGLMWHQQLCGTAAKELGIPCLFLENGPLPGTTAIDRRGVNYLNSVPREKQFYQDLDISQYTELPDHLTVRENHKHKSKDEISANLKKLPEKYIFVPFQVDIDRQIICYSPWIKNMPALYQTLNQACDFLPEGCCFVIKEHPSCKKDYSNFHNKNQKILFANNISTEKLIKESLGVLTINSSVGLESLLFNKPVITTGQAFYNIPDIVENAKNFTELTDAIKHTPFKVYNTNLTLAFLNYLYHEYLVKGDWREANSEHLSNAIEKIQELLHEQ